MDFDETRLYYSHQQLHQSGADGAEEETDPINQQVVLEDEEAQVPVATMRRHFREFFRTYSDCNKSVGLYYEGIAHRSIAGLFQQETTAWVIIDTSTAIVCCVCTVA